MSNLGFHTDANFEYGDQWGRIAGTSGHLAAITNIMNPNDLTKASPAINAAVNKALRFHNVETNMSGTDNGQFTALQNVTTAINAIKPALALYPNARWAYFRNEIGDWTKADFYALEMKLWVEELAKLGYYGGICCWSFGTPDYSLWPKFDTALAAANANGGAVLLHEYGVLTMKSMYEPAKGTGHHCLRYRNVWAQNNYPTRFPKLMWWVTETGLDKDVNTGVGGGWKTCATANQYLSDLYWYDNEISKDGVSATVYQWGTDPVWSDYDIQGPVVDNLLARIGATTPNLKPGGTIPPTTPPVDPPQQPPTGPETVTVFDMALEYDPPKDARHYAPGDDYGDRWLPLDDNDIPLFTYYWADPPDGKIAHVEPYPPYDTGYAAPFALRIQNQSSKQQQFWAWLDIETVPGDIVTVTMDSEPVVEGGTGTVTRRIVVDPAGGTDALKLGLPFTETTAPTAARVMLAVTATGPLTSIMALVKWKIPLRVNVDISKLTVMRTRGATPPTQPPSNIVKPNWNMRTLPDSSGSGNIVSITKYERPVEIIGDSGDFKKVVVYIHKDAFK